jgi:hypothetical protein
MIRSGPTDLLSSAPRSKARVWVFLFLLGTPRKKGHATAFRALPPAKTPLVSSLPSPQRKENVLDVRDSSVRGFVA